MLFYNFQIDWAVSLKPETTWIQLDIRTKLCIRDSLYRLARSAEQRHNCAIMSGNGDDCDGSRALMVPETNKYAITACSQTFHFQCLLRCKLLTEFFHSVMVMWLQIAQVISCFITSYVAWVDFELPTCDLPTLGLIP